MILLSDANVLIDLGYIDRLDVLPKLGKVEVLDIVLDECMHPKQPNLPEKILKVGIEQIVVTDDWYYSAQTYQQKSLSPQDILCFYYAKTFNRILMTNEKPLRELCKQYQIKVHGTLWVIQQASQRAIIPNKELCNWLLILSQHNRRLPKQELLKIRNSLNC